MSNITSLPNNPLYDLIRTLKPSEFFSDEARWCKSNYAVDKNLNTTELGGGQECQICLAGYFHLKALILGKTNYVFDIRYREFDEYVLVFDHIQNKYGRNLSVSGFNDWPGRTSSDVVKLLQEVGL